MYDDSSPYHRRVARRLQKSRESRGNRYNNQFISVDKFLCTFEAVYNQYYQTNISIRYRRGWYYIGKEHLHKSDLVRLLERMLVQLHLDNVPSPNEEE